MKVRTTSGSLWAISLPIMVAGVSETIVDVTDAIFLGHYGITELGAVALADAIYMTLVVFTVGLADGIQVIVARRAGEGKREEIGRTFGQGLYLLGIASVVLFLLLKFGSPFVTAGVISSGDVRTAVDDFLQIIAFAVFFDAINFGFSAFYVGIARTRVLIWATALLAMTNIALDYCLIFGNLGFPEMGIRGAATASLTAEIVAFVFLAVHAVVRGYARSYGLFTFRRWNARLTRVLYGVSYPVALEGLVESIRWFVFFAIVEQLGEVALAGSNVIYSCYVVLLVPLNGFSEAVATTVSNLIGQGKANRIGVPIRKAIGLGFLVTTPILVLVAFGPEWVLSLFTTDAMTIAASVPSLLVVAGAILLAIPGDMLVQAVYGTADTKATFGIELVLSSILVVYVWIAALQLGLPLHYVWAAEVLGWAIRSVLGYYWLKSQAWRRLEV